MFLASFLRIVCFFVHIKEGSFQMAKAYIQRVKPITAVEWTGENKAEVEKFIGQMLSTTFDVNVLLVPTVYGTVDCHVGDFVIQDQIGFYVCRQQSFLDTYEPYSE